MACIVQALRGGAPREGRHAGAFRAVFGGDSPGGQMDRQHRLDAPVNVLDRK